MITGRAASRGRATGQGTAAANQVRHAESALHDWLANALGDRDAAAASRALRKLVDGRPAGDAIARRRDGVRPR